MDEILQQVTGFADKAHGAQLRKYTPERYIVHPVRVMEMCRVHHATLPVLAAALLHDVLEDTAVSQQQMAAFLLTVMEEGEAKRTIELVVELTDVYTKKKYSRWNRRKRKEKEARRIEQTSGDSQTVKYADIIDNCREIAVHDPEFATVFLNECRMLLKRMPRGNPGLYRQAIETVDNCLRQLPPPAGRERKKRFSNS
jgi:(p)ppGpp synthase/HD superfamily hydrolase